MMKTILALIFVASITTAQLRPPQSAGGGGTPASSLKLPGTITADDNGDFNFVNPDNAKTENGVSATGAFTADGTSDALLATNFSFSVPVGSTINGVLVEWKASVTVTDDAFNGSQYLIIGGTPTGITPDGGSAGNTLEEALEFYSAGGSTDTWTGTLPSVSQVNASDFGASINFQTANSLGTVSVDVIRVTVYYTTAGGSSTSQIRLGKTPPPGLSFR